MIFKLTENGVEKEYELVFSFMSPDTGNTYAVYTDNVEMENGTLRRYTAIVDSKPDEELRLRPIESPLEQAIVDDALDSIRRQMQALMDEAAEQ